MNVLLTWRGPAAKFPQGTADEDHYVAKLGDMQMMINLDLGGDDQYEALFSNVAPGAYIPSVYLADVSDGMIGVEIVGEMITVPEPQLIEVDRHPPVDLVVALQ
jgi:hypothetical protein